MNDVGSQVGILRELTLNHMLLVLAIVAGGGLLAALVRGVVHRVADSAPSHRRLVILRLAPIARLLIAIVVIGLIVPILVEPNLEDIIALGAAVGLALAFALKDYVSCVIAGVVAILENTYQPGDWIEIDGVYGEVKKIGTRAVHVVTPDDTEVIIPHARLWSKSISNASSGKHSLLCVTDVYLQADHDGEAVYKSLAEIAESSSYRESGSVVKIVAAEKPWGTQYKIKAYVHDSRQQFDMITEVTIRAKQKLRSMNIAFAQAPFAERAEH